MRRPGLTAGCLAHTAVLWASAFPAIKTALPGYGVAGLSFLRLAVASLALAAAAPLLKVRVPRARDLPLIAGCGLAGMSAYQLLLNWGEVHVAAGTASLLVSAAPVFSVLLAASGLGERLTRPVLAGSVIALGGCALIALAGGKSGYSAAAWAVLGAAFIQGVYHFGTKPLLRRYRAVEVACYCIWTGTLALTPIAPAAVTRITTASLSASLAVVALGVLPSALGFVTWGYAVSRSSIAAATSVLYLVPAIALGVSYVWLGEIPTLVELAGGAVSIAGVVLIRRASSRTRLRDGDEGRFEIADPVPGRGEQQVEPLVAVDERE